MFYAVFGTLIYAGYTLFYLAGVALIVWAVRDVRRELGGGIRLGLGILLCLIPTAVIASALLGY